MKKSMFSILVAVICFTAVSRAGEFEDRQAKAQEKRIAVPLAKCNAAIARYTREFITAIQFFNADHPIANVANCVTRESGCQLSAAFWNVIDMGGQKNQSFKSIKPDNHTSVVSCDLRLKNGMLCRTAYTSSKENLLDITCYDKSGNEETFGIPYSAVR